MGSSVNDSRLVAQEKHELQLHDKLEGKGFLYKACKSFSLESMHWTIELMQRYKFALQIEIELFYPS